MNGPLDGAAAAPAPATAVTRLTGLVGALRAHGFGIGTGETVDAGLALRAVGFTDRERVREALAATLLHGGAQRPVFDRVFDLYFPLGHGPAVEAYEDAPAGPAELAALRDRLAEALVTGDAAALDRLAAEAVGGFGGYGSGPESDGWSSYRTLG
ncbi:hypothetical protein GTW71_19630, partial [Streptomyces sp. SID6041]|nr:hypothetical protein [Streptomyces sp. SID6041]